MILDTFIILISVLMNVILVFISAFNFVLPVEIETSIIYFLSPLQYVAGYIAVDTAFFAVGVMSIFYGYLYFFKVILWIYSMIPFIGRKVQPPFRTGKGNRF